MVHDLIKDLPIPQHLGQPIESELLCGMGYGRAYRVKTVTATFALKCATENRERLFYEILAPTVIEAGIQTPKLYWSQQRDRLSWVALEWIPEILPESRWRIDDEVFKTLSLLHNLEIDLKGILFEKIQWTEKMNMLAMSIMPKKISNELESVLRSLSDQFQYLFEPNFFLSGDPSGRNWGIRDDGQLVLFDWERFGFGMPQLDLSCVAFGEPPTKVFREISKGYLMHNLIETDLEKFTMEIQIARVHCCINMLSTHAKGLAHLPQKAIDLTITGLVQLIDTIK